MKKHLLTLLALTPLTLTSCGNLFKGLSTPEGDEQLLVAARGCMDRGDYNCALEYYQALSNNYGDVKVNETSLAKLANANVFKMSDLIGALGSSRGDGASFTTMANSIAPRGVANATNRLLIQTTYTDNSAIVNDKLKAFSKFISALSMVNLVLAEVAGADQLLTASDLVSDAVACKAAVGTCNSNPVCGAPFGGSDLGSSPANMNAPTGWDGAATLLQFVKAAETANQEIATFTGNPSNTSGIFGAIQEIANSDNAGVTAAFEPCIRQTIMNTLGL